ncbi:DUF4405 domain-containing protein [Paenibacillus sp. NPDC056579]|uniref:DUF4405 domain-containing protein n=1 Tax=Paenibacillus sp. NPDC056579 TaxID=3345871 RepID=UPI0036741DCE
MTKKKSYVKLTLDAAMGITFALLFNKMVMGGLAFHEIAGTAIGFAILTHILLNVPFVKKITFRLLDKSLPGKTRLSYGLNVLLLISMTFVIVSGLLISRVLLPEFRYGNENWFKLSHMGVSYLTLTLIGIHIGLHWHWVMKVTQRLLNLKLSMARTRILMTCAAVIVLLFGAYQTYSTHFISKLEMMEVVFTGSSAPTGQGGMHRTESGSSLRAESGRPEGMKQGDNPERRTMKPAEGASGGGAPGGGRISPNFVSVIATYFGIMAVFAGLTYYMDKWAGRKKRISVA